MAPADGGKKDHPVQPLLRAMLKNKVRAVVMGHDNENWIDKYYEGDDIFTTDADRMEYADTEDLRGDLTNPGLVDDAIDQLEDGDFEALAELAQGPEGEAALSAALTELEAREELEAIDFGTFLTEDWGIEAQAAIHFVHVNDIGAYKHDDEDDFEDYGYVVATLEGGVPLSVQNFCLDRDATAGPVRDLEQD
jgi:hypothetical protein